MLDFKLCATANTGDSRTVAYMNEYAIPSLKKEIQEWQSLDAEGCKELQTIQMDVIGECQAAIDLWQERLENNS